MQNIKAKNKSRNYSISRTFMEIISTSKKQFLALVKELDSMKLKNYYKKLEVFLNNCCFLKS